MTFLKNKNLSFKIGLALALIHLSYFIILFVEAARSTHEQAGFDLLMTFMVLDIFLYPLWGTIASILWFFIDNDHLHFQILLIIQYGILGTLSWFFIPIGIAKIFRKFTRPKVREQFK